MIFAAGRGERMRPLTDTCPKPLLAVGGKPLIVWKIEALARAGFKDIVINHAWLGGQIEHALGDGSRFGVRLAYSAEIQRAGNRRRHRPGAAAAVGRARAREIFLAVSGDIFTDFDFRALLPRALAMAGAPEHACTW
ncbi:nucleotidyltransferase family protein [Cupriavidus basilensis]